MPEVGTGMRPQFFRTLFDFSFTEFVTPKVIKLVYALGIAAAGLFALVIVLAGLTQSAWAAIWGLIFGAILFVFLVIAVRMWLEVAMLFFRIADTTAEIAEHEAAIALNTAGPSRET